MRSKFTGGGPRQDLRCRLGSNDVSQRDRTINVSRTQAERRKSRELDAASAGASISRPADRAVYLFVFAWLSVAVPTLHDDGSGRANLVAWRATHSACH